MKKLIIRYKCYVLRVHTSENNTTILNSYRIKNLSDMKAIIEHIKKRSSKDMAINKRSVSGMIYEWRTHNLLYSLGIEKDRTKSVDLNTNQPWYVKVAYFCMSPFYFHFS